MKTNLAGVDLFVMIYAWSHKRTTMIVSTSGKTIRHKIDYHSKFVDAFDNTTYKELPRPAVLHQAFHFLPLIDEANKERQSTLALEKKWLTKNCWTRVITSLVGECVVDMMRWDRHKRAGLPIIFHSDMQDFDISEMANMVTKPVVVGCNSLLLRAKLQSHSCTLLCGGVRSCIPHSYSNCLTYTVHHVQLQPGGLYRESNP